MPDAPKAVLFDLGDTILREVSYDIHAGFNSVSNHFSRKVTLESLERATEKIQSETREFQLLHWIEERLTGSTPSSDANEVELALWKNTVSLTPIEDCRLALEYLVERDVRIAAVSNAIFSSACMRYELKRHDLLHYFEFVLSSADLGVRKPDPRIFQSALDTLGLPSKDVWFIGDRWDADIIGANAMQITAVWFGEQPQEDNPVLEHLKLRRWGDFEALWAEQRV